MGSLRRMKRWTTSPRRRFADASSLGAIAVALLAPTLAQAAPDAGASIVGGDVASIAEFPSLAFIAAQTGRNQGFACTGTVIAPRLVLTAAHCVEDLEVGGFTPANRYVVATGQADPRQIPPANLLRVASTHVYPRFDPGTTHGDAALLVLATPTPAPAIPLAGAADGALYEGGTGVLLAGWGLTKPNARSAPRSLRSTSTVVLNGASCKQRTRSFYPPYSSAVEMCTTDPPDHANGGCFGDSGGPALARRPDGSLVEIGITSTGAPECSTKLPNIFTRADRISAWASEWIAAVEGGGPPPSLKPQLPGMTRESAQGFVAGLLATEIGRPFLDGEILGGDCRRLGAARVKCELAWLYGASIYFGGATVFYALKQDTVAWDNSYAVERVNARCWLESDHTRSCPAQIRRG
jgi:trypsin